MCQIGGRLAKLGYLAVAPELYARRASSYRFVRSVLVEAFGADAVFKAKFSALCEMCTDSKELGYEMLWQGAP